MAATKTKASSGGSSTSSTKKSAPSKPTLSKDPFKTVSDFRDSIDKSVEELYLAGQKEAADVLRALRKQIDVLLPEAVAEREKRLEAEAIGRNSREIRAEAIKKARR